MIDHLLRITMEEYLNQVIAVVTQDGRFIVVRLMLVDFVCTQTYLVLLESGNTERI